MAITDSEYVVMPVALPVPLSMVITPETGSILIPEIEVPRLNSFVPVPLTAP